MDIDKYLLKEIEDYCKANNITDISKLVNKMLKQGFTIEKFGFIPTIDAKHKKKPKKEANKYQIDLPEKEEEIIEKQEVVKITEKPLNPPKKDIYGE